MRVRAREREYVHASSCACLISLRGNEVFIFLKTEFDLFLPP